jgi:hypothetical protein
LKNKNALIISAVIAGLVLTITILVLLNGNSAEDKQASQDNATVTVVAGDVIKTFDLEYLKSLPKEEFSAVEDTSSTGPEQKSFGGVPLAAVLEDLGFSLDGAERVVFRAVDDYVSSVTAEEAADTENVYLVYERGGKPSGIKRQGGSGPIEVVVRKDAFAQRWCKYLMEIDIE